MTQLFLSVIGETPTQHGRARRGVVMVIVLSILLILAMMGVVFVTFQSLEKRVAVNFTDDVRSKMLAQSGIEYAVAELQRTAGTSGLFGTDDSGTISVFTMDRTWIYYGTVNDETQPPNPSTTLAQAVNPSYAVEIDNDPSNGPAAAAARTAIVNGAARGFSGIMSTGTYASNGDVFALRVTDESGKINVNDGVFWGPTHAVSKNLERMLNILGNKLPTPVAGLGTTLLANRPAGGYASKLDLLAALGGNTTTFEQVRPHVSVNSWSDPNVALPVPLDAVELSKYPAGITYVRPTLNGQPLYRLGHQRNAFGKALTGLEAGGASVPLRFYDPSLLAAQPYHNGIYGHDSLNPLWIETARRSPVNVNNASKEVLETLIANLQGFFTSVERRRDRPVSYPSTSSYNWMKSFYTYDPNIVAPIGGKAGAPYGGGDGDECGFIYTTMKYVDQASTSAGELSGQVIADEILACRRSGACLAHAGAHNYAGKPFGGPFRDWAQFNVFVDYLVQQGVIYEDRGGVGNSWFFDYTQLGNIASGVSTIQQLMAAQAAGDVLKANFNPNLNLNELNPNHNLFTHVDKTDLIVNSTEFCFVPNNGTFEVESLGMVLQPDSGTDIFGSPNIIVAEKKALAVIQLYDAVRQTAQPDFHAGVFGPRGSRFTNNNAGVETGPAPDNGPISTTTSTNPYVWTDIAKASMFSGYIQLPTHGGSRHNTSVRPKNAYATTCPGLYPAIADVDGGTNFRVPLYGETIHSHFDVDSHAHYHKDGTLWSPYNKDFGAGLGPWYSVLAGYPGEVYHTHSPGPPATAHPGTEPAINQLSFWVTKGTQTTKYNWPDIPEDTDGAGALIGHGGPYDPAAYSRINYFQGSNIRAADHNRLCRSYRLSSAGSGSFTPTSYGPVDLRIDGLYCERGSSIGYRIHDIEAMKNYTTPSAAYVTASSWRHKEGTLSFWFKPNWFPESTGKVRSLISIDRFRYPAWTGYFSSGNTHYWRAAWGYDAGSDRPGVNSPPMENPWAGENSTRTINSNHWEDSNNNMSFNPAPFTLYYLPAHVSPSGSINTSGANDGFTPGTSANIGYTGGVGKLRSASFGVGTGLGWWSGGDWELQLPIYGWEWWRGGYASMPNAGSNYWQGFYSQEWPFTAPVSSTGTVNTTHYITRYSGERTKAMVNIHAAAVTPSLNHHAHGTPINYDPLFGEDGGFNRLRGHEWIHVTVNWMMPALGANVNSTDNTFEIYVNGEAFSIPTNHSATGYSGSNSQGNPRQTHPLWFLENVLGTYNGWSGPNAGLNGPYWGATTLGIGGVQDTLIFTDDGVGPSGNGEQDAFPRRFMADGTFDEFFAWTNRGTAVAQGMNGALNELWSYGRYYQVNSSPTTPAGILADVGTFTSRPLRVGTTSAAVLNATGLQQYDLEVPVSLSRSFAPATTVVAPPPSSEGGSGGSGQNLPAPAASTARIMGISWTAYAEGYNPTPLPAGYPGAAATVMVPYMRNWINPASPVPMPLDLAADANGFAGPCVIDMYVQKNAVTPLGPYRNGAFSMIRDATGNPPSIAPTDTFKYIFKFRVSNGSVAAPILLSSPVVDDVTIYYSIGGVRYLAYCMETVR